MRRITALTLSLTLAASLTVPAFAQEDARFGDVAGSHWAIEAICRANDDGVMVGTGRTDPGTGLALFEPAADLTAAQFITIVINGFYPDKIEEAEGAWYMPFANAASKAGLFTGVLLEDWEAPMTRYQMAAVLANIAADKGLELPAAASIAIADRDQIPEQYKEAVRSAYALGLLSGVDDRGTFAGDQTLNRAQAAVVYGKLADAIGPEEPEPDGDPMQAKLDQLIAEIEGWNWTTGLPAATYELYPSQLGTLFLGNKTGLPHNTGTQLFFVQTDGTTLDILELLPSYFMYGANYVNPRDIQFSEDGARLTFITPVREGNAVTGEEKDWGDTLCTVDLTAGTMASMEPVQGE